SRLQLAAGSAIMNLAQEPCYHEIITPEQFQLCALVINDECYQVRQIFSQKLHKALVKLLLPLDAHARQCLPKNISIRREYIKQNPMATEKLLSLLPEYLLKRVWSLYDINGPPQFCNMMQVSGTKGSKSRIVERSRS
uniref:Uncharacterized protein n=1 Tax=Cercocebus atys TaxID=9531 RepID=A0A2K5LM33_CERAT